MELERVTPEAAARLANDAMLAAVADGAGDRYARALDLLAAAAAKVEENRRRSVTLDADCAGRFSDDRRRDNEIFRASQVLPEWRGWTL